MKVVIKHAGKWLQFQSPEKVLRADTLEEVLPRLEEAEQSGLFAAGLIAYEASPAFDPALTTHDSNGFPLLCLGLFQAPVVLDDIEEPPDAHFEIGQMKPSVSRKQFTEVISRIKEQIAAGATYQVNYTYRLKAEFSGDAWAFFCDLVRDQRTDHAVFIETDEFTICSASPELFFSYSNGHIVARPMKGTARRGRTFDEDGRQAEALRLSEKDRAENIMIVDMIRNDIGRVAIPGSVETLSTYDIEKYPTIWQMTSTVEGRINHEDTKNTKAYHNKELQASRSSCLRGDKNSALLDVIKALFPCASITGAPKAKTMEIIQELESSPRKVYTGALGFITPAGEASFNVAIRTAVIDKATGILEYGVGGGIVWDSDADEEYEETLTKARILTAPRPDFELLETLLWTPSAGYFLLNEHLQRLGKSAAYFDIPLDIHAVLNALEETADQLEQVPHRIRLLVSREGDSEIQTFPLEEGRAGSPSAPRTAQRSVPTLSVALAKEPIDSEHVFLFHKTTHRDVYEQARADRPDTDDVILWNERGEVTESTVANIVIRKGGRLVTPPVDSGLLAGTFRGALLASGEITEATVSIDELRSADEVYLINSVQKWKRALLN
jgi:para-aminobenzoate synthetase/4-amino-4-deoxychorismate lyase